MKKIIGFVEDPGAANFFVEDITNIKGHKFILYAAEPAFTYLKNKNVNVTFLNTEIIEDDIFRNDCKLFILGTSENKNSFAFKLIDYAKKNNIKTLSVLDSPASLEFRFKGNSNNSLKYITDYIVTYNTVIKNKLIKLGLSSKKIFLCKFPYYNLVQKLEKNFICYDKNKKIKELFGDNYINQKLKGKKIIVFLSELSSGLDDNEFIKNNEYLLLGNKKSYLRTDVVLDELLIALDSFKDKIFFVVRLHPKDKALNYKKYFSKIDYFSEYENPLEVVYFSDLIIGMTTSLLNEAAIMNKKVLSITPRLQEYEWLTPAMTPNISHVCTKEDLNFSIIKLLENKSHLKYKRKDISYKSIYRVIQKLINEY